MPEDEAGRRVRWFRAVLGTCFAATLLVSYRAWLSSGREYPPVPVVDGLPQPPFPLDRALFAGMIAALAGMAFARRPRPYLVAVLAIMGAWLVLDQTRWQPYVLTLVAGTGCLLLGESRALRATGDAAARWHMAPYQLSLCATYLWSGLHKLNAGFVEQTFRGWMHPITRVLGIDQAPVAGVLRAGGVAAALGEAAMGVALLFPRTRRMAVVGLTLMHAYIMLHLGVQGRAGNTVVWPWNVLVVATLWLLFWPREPAARLDGFIRAWWPRRRGTTAVPRPLRRAWVAALVLFGVMPALSFVEMWPASLSFQLYAGKQRQVRIYYRPGQDAGLPPSFLRAERAPGRVDLGRWAMGDLNVVPVMDTHVVTRVVRELAQQAPDAGVRVLIGGAPGPVSGNRGYRTFVFDGPDQAPREVPTFTEAPTR